MNLFDPDQPQTITLRYRPLGAGKSRVDLEYEAYVGSTSGGLSKLFQRQTHQRIFFAKSPRAFTDALVDFIERCEQTDQAEPGN